MIQMSKEMDLATKTTRVPDRLIAGLVRMIERIFGEAAGGNGRALVAETCKERPT